MNDATLEAQRARWTPPEAPYARGYGWMYAKQVAQANEGCDFDYLETGFGERVTEPVIY